MTRTNSKGYSLTAICNYVGISRQAYYKRVVSVAKKSLVYQQAEAVVINSRKNKSRAGLRSIWYKESLHSLLGLNQFEVQMSLQGYALKPYKSRIKTTDSRGHHYKFNNLISGKQVNKLTQRIK